MMTSGNLSNYRFLSKPFTYALSLDQLGAEVVQKYIGREPSGRTFNEIAVDYNGTDILTYTPFP
jgi:glutaminase